MGIKINDFIKVEKIEPGSKECYDIYNPPLKTLRILSTFASETEKGFNHSGSVLAFGWFMSNQNHDPDGANLSMTLSGTNITSQTITRTLSQGGSTARLSLIFVINFTGTITDSPSNISYYHTGSSGSTQPAVNVAGFDTALYSSLSDITSSITYEMKWDTDRDNVTDWDASPTTNYGSLPISASDWITSFASVTTTGSPKFAYALFKASGISLSGGHDAIRLGISIDGDGPSNSNPTEFSIWNFSTSTWDTFTGTYTVDAPSPGETNRISLKDGKASEYISGGVMWLRSYGQESNSIFGQGNAQVQNDYKIISGFSKPQ